MVLVSIDMFKVHKHVEVTFDFLHAHACEKRYRNIVSKGPITRENNEQE